VAYLVERQRSRRSCFAEMTPILRAVMGTATERLDTLEKRGYFAFGRELVGSASASSRASAPRTSGSSATRSWHPRDRESADPARGARHRGRGLAALRTPTPPSPSGIVGMVKATRDDNVQKGMAVMMELMRHVGRAAQAVAAQQRATRRGAAPRRSPR
jgi:hypothetical protein